MRLYLDDDLASPVLAQMLRNAGQDVQLPADVGHSGKDDPIHLTHAVRESRPLLTRNYGDFENLHNLVMTVKGHHPGILVVRRDNDPRRNLSHRDIVGAIGKLEPAAVPLEDQYIILNHWC
jgi:hypothetical protein